MCLICVHALWVEKVVSADCLRARASDTPLVGVEVVIAANSRAMTLRRAATGSLYKELSIDRHRLRP
jgi:hypothetical protein